MLIPIDGATSTMEPSIYDEFAAFVRDARTEAKARYREDRNGQASPRAYLTGTRPLAERLYVRPKRTGRACGSRHRVML